MILTNIHTSAVTVEVELVSDTGSRGGANNVANGTSFLVKDVNIPNGSSLEILSGGKVILETGYLLRVDCSVACLLYTSPSPRYAKLSRKPYSD